MARRFSGLRNRMIRSGRKTFWFDGAIVETNLPSALSATLVTSLTATALALRPFTIVRTRGYWAVHSDQNAADESQQVAYGSIVVSDQAVAVGAAAIPTPVEQSGSSWIHYDMTFQRFEFVSSVGIQPNMAPWMRTVDSKSMRKVEEGQDLVEVIQAGGASDGADVVTFLRTLIKLH